MAAINSFFEQGQLEVLELHGEGQHAVDASILTGALKQPEMKSLSVPKNMILASGNAAAHVARHLVVDMDRLV